MKINKIIKDPKLIWVICTNDVQYLKILDFIKKNDYVYIEVREQFRTHIKIFENISEYPKHLTKMQMLLGGFFVHYDEVEFK